jgi:hypothetical protein
MALSVGGTADHVFAKRAEARLVLRLWLALVWPLLMER